MKRLIRSLLKIICIVLSLSIYGCNNVIESMDRSSVEYSGATYSIASQYWEMISLEEYTAKTITNNNTSLRIRTYPYDIECDFIYVENDSLLYHNNESKFPNNNKDDINYLLLRFHEGTTELEVDNKIIDEFLSLISQKQEKYVDVNKNIASLLIFYKDYPACYFYGNIIIDKDYSLWLELNYDTNSYIKIDDSSELSSVLKANIK